VIKIISEKNIKRVVLYSCLFFIFSVVVYSVPNPGHLTSEIEAYFAGDNSLEDSLPKFQGLINSCTAPGEAITAVNPDGTVNCAPLTAKWGAPSSIIARDGGNGNFGGYQAMADKCTGPGEHVCDASELTAWSQINGNLNERGWYNTGVRSGANPITVWDCLGWNSQNNVNYGSVWWDTYPNIIQCNQNYDVLCCVT
jgi:hypothetical protein